MISILFIFHYSLQCMYIIIMILIMMIRWYRSQWIHNIYIHVLFNQVYATYMLSIYSAIVYIYIHIYSLRSNPTLVEDDPSPWTVGIKHTISAWPFEKCTFNDVHTCSQQLHMTTTTTTATATRWMNFKFLIAGHPGYPWDLWPIAAASVTRRQDRWQRGTHSGLLENARSVWQILLSNMWQC